MVMFAVGIWLVPALGGDRLDPGHSRVGLWLIGSATSLAAIGLALCVAVCVRTTLQAPVAGHAIRVPLAALACVLSPKLDSKIVEEGKTGEGGVDMCVRIK